RAKKIIKALQYRNQAITEQEILNTIREYIQTIILKIIFQSKYGSALSFMGGTALRICYNIKRYSDDLDFALDNPKEPYDFFQLIKLIQKELIWLKFDVTSSASKDKIVQKGFLRFAGLGKEFGLKSLGSMQKLHVKIEVDISPIPIKTEERESFFVNRFQEIFPILKHTLPTLFAGKVLAILKRPYNRGRDYYDLIWYLTQKTELNLVYLNRGLKNANFKNQTEVLNTLQKKIQSIDPSMILKDMSRFLEDPTEKDWILKYQELYNQLTERLPMNKYI
ncbi:MAG: nucleotidyl transferase AbiEii/AbiGii toxin family protein, partial [Deltaproteobacteria bacterium]|nr:nucleotidyl transferase AbiEii/AbiGii toxin family protein [Deltaproteobacteria bacterium]